MKAGLTELKLELFLRLRESGKLVWKTKQGESIPIKDMGIQHLINTINMLLDVQYQEDPFDHIGDMSPMDYWD